MEEYQYKTITGTAETIYKEKGSKFIALSFPVTDETKSKKILTKIRKTYFNAQHHCFAYILGTEMTTIRCSDDGEPSGTAGKQILEQIQSKGLTNILIIVVRYFGGIKLGKGGLSRAYKTATSDVINKSGIITKAICDTYKISFNYNTLPAVMKILKAEKAKLSEQKFEATCSVIIKISKENSQKILERLKKISGVELKILI
ncbi:MAG: YigZ family protein [Bacteroidia bacterium]|nr:YigZ family protein [Bacteroidia bacterium]